MYEKRYQALLSFEAFIKRLFIHFSGAIVIVFGSLVIGIIGYHFLEQLSWLDSLLNAAMILGGMGPVNPLHTPAGKLFASFYALYSGIVFLVVAGLLFAPFFHRFFHRFHLEIVDEENANS